MARKVRFLLSSAGLLTFGSLALAAVSEARKLPSATFQRFAVNGTDFKDALSACNFARQGTGWQAVGFDPPNTGGGVNCKYKKGGSSGEQVAASLVFRCPENASPWMADGVNDVNKQVCACFEGFVASGLVCVKDVPAAAPPAKDRSPDKICADALYDKLKEGYEESCKRSGGMSCSKSKLGRKQYGEMTCEDAKARLAPQKACLAARQEFQQKCFASVDERHKPVIAAHEQGVRTCEATVLEKCGSPRSR